jgi:hypothetical protein
VNGTFDAVTVRSVGDDTGRSDWTCAVERQAEPNVGLRPGAAP